MDVNSARYEAQYAYDMNASSAVEVCEKADCELVHSGNGRWRWKRGDDHSYDTGHGSGFFDTKDEAAIDFTQSQSFRTWLRQRGVYV